MRRSLRHPGAMVADHAGREPACHHGRMTDKTSSANGADAAFPFPFFFPRQEAVPASFRPKLLAKARRNGVCADRGSRNRTTSGGGYDDVSLLQCGRASASREQQGRDEPPAATYLRCASRSRNNNQFPFSFNLPRVHRLVGYKPWPCRLISLAATSLSQSRFSLQLEDKIARNTSQESMLTLTQAHNAFPSSKSYHGVLEASRKLMRTIASH